MSTNNIQFHDKIRKFPQNIILVFLSYWNNFLGMQKTKVKSTMVNEPSMFESLKFYYIYLLFFAQCENAIHVKLNLGEFWCFNSGGFLWG